VKDVDQVRHGIRWKTVMTQLRQSRPRWKTPRPKHPPPPRSETIKKQISESMKNFFASEEGKTNKQKAHEKRSKTIKERREQLRESIIEIKEKQCRSCQKVLEISQFCKKAASADGYQSYCKPCILFIKQKKKEEKMHE